MEKLKNRMMTVLTVAILMMPVISIAGNLEPSAAPAPTMKTLDQIPPTWSLTLQGNVRFEVLSNMGNYAVLDKETGLVWGQGPQAANFDWYGSQDQCRRTQTGGRRGWRLPTIEELSTLLEAPYPYTSASLPSGHPFSPTLLSAPFWSATSPTGNPLEKLRLDFNNGQVSSVSMTEGGTTYTLCVRGGNGFEN